jgi:hypothetical protein
MGTALGLDQQAGLSPVADAEVSRAQFTSEIVAREPVDRVVTLHPSDRQIYYFTELRNLQGRRVFHRWEYEGRKVSEVAFEVAGPRWRVYSKKELEPAMTGKWTVWVVDQSGWPLHASMFEYRGAD